MVEARALGPASCPPQLSLHVMALSSPLFDNYLLCCLRQGWGHVTYINDTKTLVTHVCPTPPNLTCMALTTYIHSKQSTACQIGRLKGLSVKCCYEQSICYLKKVLKRSSKIRVLFCFKHTWESTARPGPLLSRWSNVDTGGSESCQWGWLHEM